jgi:alpha-L-arabinofuranosidase
MNVDCSVAVKTLSAATARVLHHPDLNACNTFDAPDQVVPRAHQASAAGSRLRVELPPLSVVTATLRLS